MLNGCIVVRQRPSRRGCCCWRLVMLQMEYRGCGSVPVSVWHFINICATQKLLSACPALQFLPTTHPLPPFSPDASGIPTHTTPTSTSPKNDSSPLKLNQQHLSSFNSSTNKKLKLISDPAAYYAHGPKIIATPATQSHHQRLLQKNSHGRPSSSWS